MKAFKLYYYNRRGRAELARLVFAQAGVAYEDVRLTNEEWTKLKNSGKTPFGQIPILEIIENGETTTLAQSRSIAAFIARENGLCGKNNLEQSKLEMISDALEDVTLAIIKFAFEKDKVKQDEYLKDAMERVIPNIFNGLEKILEGNEGGDGFFVGKEVTLADIQFFDLADVFATKFPSFEVLNNKKKLLALKKRVETLANIANYIAIRPTTESY